MAEENFLERARRLFRQGKADQVLSLLEPQIFRYRDDPEFYKFLAAACLEVHDWNGAKTYLERLDQLFDGEDSDIRLALAACQARSGDWTGALSSWLSVLDLNPRSRLAQRGLRGLRRALAANRATVWVRSPEFKHCVPTLIRKGLPPQLASRIVLVVILAGVATGVYLGWDFVHKKYSPPTEAKVAQATVERPGPSEPSLGTLPVVQSDGLWTITLTDAEVRKTWAEAQKDFQEYRDSLARREINKILLSNASEAIKQRARGLIPFLRDPDFTTFHDNVDYSVVRQDPDLYEGCAVRWKGVVSNLVSGKTRITFDLLLGFQEGQVVEGIVPVVLKFAALLRNSQILDVLGTIEKGPKGTWMLHGVAIQEDGFKLPAHNF
jgi:tetratricopeptide (TPR) repeat protein